MGKNTDTTNKAAAPAKRTAIRPAKAASSKPKRTVKPAAPKARALSTDDVALRAYFLAEKRRRDGLPGDEHQDWIEAERQLSTESNGAKPAGRKKASAA